MHDAKIQPSLCRRPTAPHRETLLRPNKSSRLDEADLVGNLKSVEVGSQSNVSLLPTVRSDKGVDLGSLDVVELLNSILDVPLVGLDVNDEDQSVVLLNLLHSRLSVERVLDSSELVHPGEVVDRLSGVLGSTGETEGAGSVEGDGSSDLSDGGGLGALQGGLFGGLGLDILGLGSGLTGGLRRGHFWRCQIGRAHV